MDETKFFLASKRVQGLIIAGLGLLLPQLGIDITDQATVEFVGNFAAVAGTIWTLYGQYAKKKRLRLSPKPKAPEA